MGKVFDTIDEKLASWISKQHLFFVSTAPLSADGLINCSPKGLDSFRILDPTTVAYLDLVGSGIETLAHLKQNGRIVIMFCAFEGPPNIVRIHGTGTAHEKGSERFEDLKKLFPDHPGSRAIIEVKATRISDSCGYAVPLMKFESERDALTMWADKKGAEQMAVYCEEQNAKSIDGLDGVELPVSRD